MAEGIVSTLVEKLSIVIEKEANLLLGVDEQVRSLRNELEWIMHFMKDAENKRNKIPMVDVWVRQVRDLAYDAEDVIDAFVLHAEQEERRKSNICLGVIGTGNKLKTLHEIGKKIEIVTRRSKEISDYRSRYNLDVSQDSDYLSQSLARRRRTIPTIEEPFIVGLQEEATQLANWLMNEEDRPQRRVMSIIGMGGLGKTTLAKKIYNRDDVKKYFNACAWICVSQEYHVRDLLVSILNQLVKGVTCADMDDAQLKEKLCNYLRRERYLVVVDDIWKTEVWDQIDTFFPENHKGARVLLTTRNKDVALCADPLTHHHHELRLLSKDEGWELFCKKVFSSSGGSCPLNLVEVGEKIVEKCGGLPLAIVVLGGLLIGKERTHDAWSKVLASVNWQLSQDSNPCREVLALSYTELPYYLKSCFLYIGIYPEDFEIGVKRLISLWIGEDFVQARGEEKMEDVAEDYLEELIQRSMLQVATRKYDGGTIQTCRVHDLLRDLAISEGIKDRLLDIHRSNCINEVVTNIRSRRSLLAFHKSIHIDIWISTFGEGIKMLRVLDLSGSYVKKGLLKRIGKLSLLHYLGLRGCYVGWLPSSFGNLVRLQTLDLGENHFQSLPNTIWKMKNLRHLHLNYGCRKLRKPIAVTTSNFVGQLLTLWTHVGMLMSEDWELSNALTRVGCLRSLRVWSYEGFQMSKENLKNCLPSSLTELHLEISIKEDPSGVLGSLPNLKVLRIGCFKMGSDIGTKMHFAKHGFPQLQYIELSHLHSLMEWIVEDGAMPSLRHLKISLCRSLQELPDGLKNINTLQKVELEMSAKFRDRVKEDGEDWNKIKHVPSITATNDFWSF